MGVDLLGYGWSASMNWWSWDKCFTLAVEHGWHPAGTTLFKPSMEELLRAGERIPPETLEVLVPVNSSFGYFSNDLQMVTAVDARGFADGIERAVRAGALDPTFAERFIRRFRISHFVIL
jgi:hypothetical protein